MKIFKLMTAALLALAMCLTLTACDLEDLISFEAEPSSGETTPSGGATTPSNSGNEGEATTIHGVDNTAPAPTLELPAAGTLSFKHDPDMPVFNPTMNDYRVHLGIDIDTAVNARVYAAAEGVVYKMWQDTMMGWCIAIAHDGGLMTCYKNLDEFDTDGVKEGDRVLCGDLIGRVGDSAMVEIAQESHLHFEVTLNDEMVDPLDFLSDNALEKLGVSIDTDRPETPSNSGSSSTPAPTLELPVTGTLAAKYDPDTILYSQALDMNYTHVGIDIDTEEGAPVYAAADGTVYRITNDWRFGWCIFITHGDDLVTVYRNLCEIDQDSIKKGDEIQCGQLIGFVGDSAVIEADRGPHLHFEVHAGETWVIVDPLDFLSDNALEKLGVN